MTTPESRYRNSLLLLAEGNLVSSVNFFINPLMRSVVIAYHLADASNIKIEITDEIDASYVRNIFLIRGNAGGKAGKNKVLWDGTNHAGLKVEAGLYRIRFIANNHPVAEEKIIRF